LAEWAMMKRRRGDGVEVAEAISEFTLHQASKPDLWLGLDGAPDTAHFLPSSSDVHCERSPALDLDPLPVNHQACGDGSAAALISTASFRLIRRGAMALASWAMSFAISDLSSR
jgi:hypothetical protein